MAAKEKAATAVKDEIRAAVYLNDDAALNRIVARLLSACLLCVALGCVADKQQVVYVPTDRKIESVTNSLGIACKAVPNAVMVEMLDQIQELKDLKAEQKVDKRVTK